MLKEMGASTSHLEGSWCPCAVTIQRQAIVLHSVRGVLPHDHLHILQGLRSQRVPKAGLLPPKRKKVIISKAPRQHNPLSCQHPSPLARRYCF